MFCTREYGGVGFAIEGAYFSCGESVLLVHHEGGTADIPAVSVPAGPPPAIKIVEAPGKSLWNFLKAFAVSSWEPCKVHNGEVELVPVAKIRVEYGTDVVTEGASGLIVTVF